MQIFYKAGFFSDDNPQAVPNGAILLSQEYYLELIAGQSEGKMIVSDESGSPILIAPPPTPFHQLVAGKWVISDENQTALLTQNKDKLIKKLAEKIDSFKAQLLVGYPQAEIDSFFRQEAEVLAYQADHKAPTPMLTQIAENRGVALEELAVKVLEKSAQFAVAMGALIGVRQGFEDRILAAQNQEQLEQIENEVNAWQRSI
ncbi:Uncharacterised protein [[Pasteurella] mairii]|uniref:Tail fiber assembly protein n=1 Tax=[Pasteurella] mairii TaxID=757 RepID=A0A379B2Y5_9PAST|nr:Uncharacterised protein [[Pasteurella] mairii]